MDGKTTLLMRLAAWACAEAIKQGADDGDWEKAQAAATAIAQLIKGAVTKDRNALERLVAFLKDYDNQRKEMEAKRG